MGKAVDIYLLNNWEDYLVKVVDNDFEMLDKLDRNELFTSSTNHWKVKEAAINDLRKELGMPYTPNKTSDTLDTFSSYVTRQNIMEHLYLEAYLDNKDSLLNDIKQYLGRPTEDPISVNKKVFLKGLEDLLEKTDPYFLYNLQDYLANSEFLLNDLKKYLGIPDEDSTFDSELSILCKSGYQRLFDMISNDQIKTNGAQNYLYKAIFEEGLPYFGHMIEVGKEWLYLYVKLSFDPPTASTLTYLKERLNELERYIVNYNLGDWIYGEQKHADIKTSWD